MRLLSFALLITSFTVIPAAQSAELNGQPGLYEINLHTVMPGMDMPDQVLQECMTKEDLADPQRMLNKGGSDGCQLKDLKQENNRMNFSIICPNEQMTGQGAYLFAGDSYTGQMALTMPNPGGAGSAMSITTTTKAKRIGPCK
ncbi:MAG: DUF3617 domain-containing protein [Magnetococcus sp. DMHC-6]